MIHAIDTTLDQRPEALNCVDVVTTDRILPFAVINNSMSISELLNKAVAGKFISVNRVLHVSGNVIPNDRQDCLCFNVHDDLSDYLTSIPINQAHYRGFALCASATCAMTLATYVSLVYFGVTAHWFGLLIHKRTDLLEHSPCRFVSDSEFPLQLFSRDTASGRTNQEHCVKPRAERGGRFMEYRARSRGNTHSTEFTSVKLHTRFLVMLSYFTAFRAVYALRIASLKQELKARIIIWKLIIEVFNRILFSCHFAPLCEYYSREVTECQGIVTLFNIDFIMGTSRLVMLVFFSIGIAAGIIWLDFLAGLKDANN